MTKTKNLKPLKKKDLINEVNFDEYEYKPYLTHICDLIPDKTKEKVTIDVIDQKLVNKTGLIYVMVIDGKILKIGQSIKTIKDRVGSYNCGKIEYRIKGTASTTNYFILQTLLSINEKTEVWAFFPPEPTINVFGEEIVTSRPVTKVIENKMIEEFSKKHGKKPIGITQK